MIIATFYVENRNLTERQTIETLLFRRLKRIERKSSRHFKHDRSRYERIQHGSEFENVSTHLVRNKPKTLIFIRRRI